MGLGNINPVILCMELPPSSPKSMLDRVPARGALWGLPRHATLISGGAGGSEGTENPLPWSIKLDFGVDLKFSMTETRNFGHGAP